MIQPPVTDTGNREDILQEVLKRASSYVPEWKPEEGDAGLMLARLFSGRFSETVKKYNQMASVSYQYFLGLFQEGPRPAMPACGYVCAEPAKGAPDPVPIAKGTRLYAVSEEGERVPFEVTDSFLAVDNRVGAVFNADRGFGRIVAAQYREEGSCRLFDTREGGNLQKRRLIFTEKNILSGTGALALSVKFENKENPGKEETFERLLKTAGAMEFEQWTDAGWITLGWQKKEGASALVFTQNLPEFGYRGRTGRFLAVRLLDADGINELSFTDIRLSAGAAGIRPDCLLRGDYQLSEAERGGEILPFGDQFSIYDEFVIGSEEVFSKRGAKITLTFDLRFREKEGISLNPYSGEPLPEGMKMKRNGERKWKAWFVHREETPLISQIPPKVVERVCLEYWNGEGFRRLFTDEPCELLFNGEEEGKVTLCFLEPDDLEPARMAGISGLWIRMRILSVSQRLQSGERYRYPVIRNPELGYSYAERPVYAGPVFAEEDLEVRDLPDRNGMEERLWFRRSDDKKAASYLLLNHTLCPGVLKLHWKLERERPTSLRGQAGVDFEYYAEKNGEGGWLPLGGSDLTAGLSKSGITTFVVRGEGKEVSLFGRRGGWIRIIPKDGREMSLLSSVRFNAVSVIQQERREAEYFTALAGERGKRCILSEKNVTWLCVRVDGEEWSLTEDPGGAAPDAPVYAADFREGIVTFGNGTHGRLPGLGRSAEIRIEYRVCMGEKGNLGTFAVKGFSDAVPFMKRVSNPERITGGCGGESGEERIRRAADLVLNQNRAVSIADYEAAALRADRSVKRVRAVQENGMLTIVVLLKETDAPEEALERAAENIREELKKRASVTVVRENRIRIIRAVFVELNLTVRGTLAEGARYQEVYAGILNKLARYLNPVNGDFGGEGFEIGHLPTRTRLFHYMKTVPGLGAVKSLEISCFERNAQGGREISYESARSLPFTVPVNGTHRILLDAFGNE